MDQNEIDYTIAVIAVVRHIKNKRTIKKRRGTDEKQRIKRYLCYDVQGIS